MDASLPKPRYIEEAELGQSQLSFIENQNHCALCGSQLKITVETYLEDYTLKEEAYCSHCQIKTRVKNHKMQ